MNIQIPTTHPRYQSLLVREKIIEGCEEKVVAPAGLIAHGRGEAFDYLFGEKTPDFTKKACRAAVCGLLTAEHPVLSVNGNVACLCAGELVRLSEITGTVLEINLFYRTDVREQAILKVLKTAGAKVVYGVGKDASEKIPEIDHDRRRVDPRGIFKADLVFVPLEDGDRTEALVKLGKKVITVDLNPLSRTAQKSSITIVDNIIRVMPALVQLAEELKSADREALKKEVSSFNNKKNLAESLKFLSARLIKLAREQKK